MSFYLKILSSPGGLRDGEVVELQEGDMLAGRISPPSKICLDGAKVSKKHCVFKLAGGELRVADLHSANGVFVNGKRFESAVLKAKDRVVVGDFVFEVAHRGMPDAASAAGSTNAKPSGGKAGKK